MSTLGVASDDTTTRIGVATTRAMIPAASGHVRTQAPHWAWLALEKAVTRLVCMQDVAGRLFVADSVHQL